MHAKGWVTATWSLSETNRKARFYELTLDGWKQLDAESQGFDRMVAAIQLVLQTALGTPMSIFKKLAFWRQTDFEADFSEEMRFHQECGIRVCGEIGSRETGSGFIGVAPMAGATQVSRPDRSAIGQTNDRRHPPPRGRDAHVGVSRLLCHRHQRRRWKADRRASPRKLYAVAESRTRLWHDEDRVVRNAPRVCTQREPHARPRLLLSVRSQTGLRTCDVRICFSALQERPETACLPNT